jgi:RNA polymerase sigma-70 factor (ECF subfamily)
MRDDELVKLLHRGDPAGLEALIVRYTPYVSAVIARILKDRREDWEELTADVFLAAWENRGKLQADRLRGYLGTIARNRAFNFLRARRDALPLEDDILVIQGDGGPEKRLEAQELSQLLHRALGQLTPEQRELFVRHYYYGETVAQAAADMGINLSTAKTWLRRGRGVLKTCLEKEGYSNGSGDL